MNRIQSLREVVLLTLALLTLLPSAARAEDSAPKSKATSTNANAGVNANADAGARRERQAVAAERLKAARDRRDAALAELSLSDEQRDKLRAAQKVQADKLRAIREDTSLSREQKVAKVRELQDSLTATTKSILTAEQFEKWQKRSEARRPRPGKPAGTTSKTAPTTTGQ
ncbi:MAG: hypothetical protein KIT22_17300 [Verrucomicrobiae bacterium]|nr:hypothetical protein [Verrucomicrobiae bacterium]